MIEQKLAAWGAWVRDNPDRLNCQSPSLNLIRLAPHQDKTDARRSNRSIAPFISDDDALAVDNAVGRLMRHSVHLGVIIYLHYVKDWSVNQIASDYWSAFEYPCGKRKAKNYHVNPLLREGVGFIGGAIAHDLA